MDEYQHNMLIFFDLKLANVGRFAPDRPLFPPLRSGSASLRDSHLTMLTKKRAVGHGNEDASQSVCVFDLTSRALSSHDIGQPKRWLATPTFISIHVMLLSCLWTLMAYH